MSSGAASILVEPVNCAHCGASLDVSPKSDFVTCRYCQQRLHVRRTPSSIFTEVCEQLLATTTRLADSLDEMRLHQQLEQLDREFQMRWGKRALRQVEGESGFGMAANVVGAVFVFVFVLAWTCGAAVLFPPFALFGIGMLVMLILKMANESQQEARFHHDREIYHRQRRELIRSANELSQTQ